MNNKIKFVFVFGIAIMATFLLSKCKNPLDGFKTEINSNISSTNISLIITNANGNSIVQTPSNIKLELKGSGASRVFEVGGGKEFVVQNGIVNLILLGSDKISNTNVLSFTASLKADGFFDMDFPIVVTDTGVFSFQIPMVEINNPPSGVSLVSGNATLDGSGKLNSTFEIATPNLQGKLENVTVKIDEGTIMKDENGNAVSGNVTVKLVHYDNRSTESLRSIPGGSFAENVVDKNGNKLEPVTFETAGVMRLEISAGGQKVKTFTKPVATVMELNENTINPNTGSQIKVGDTIPVWSQDEGSNIWVYEGDEVITKDSITGKLISVANITHLSWWRRSWYWPSYYYYYYWPRCSSPSVMVTSNKSTSVYYELVNQYGSYISGGSSYFSQGSNRIFFNSQSGASARLKIYSGNSWWNKGQLLSESSLFSLCGGSANMNINFPAPTIVNLDISATCPSGRIVRPSFGIYYKESANAWWQYLGYMSNGRLTVNHFELGKTYIFGVNYNGTWYQYERIIDKTNYTEALLLKSSDFVCK